MNIIKFNGYRFVIAIFSDKNVMAIIGRNMYLTSDDSHTA